MQLDVFSQLFYVVAFESELKTAIGRLLAASLAYNRFALFVDENKCRHHLKKRPFAGENCRLFEAAFSTLRDSTHFYVVIVNNLVLLFDVDLDARDAGKLGGERLQADERLETKLRRSKPQTLKPSIGTGRTNEQKTLQPPNFCLR